MTARGDGDDRGPGRTYTLARVAAGELAGGVCREMVKPLRELREDLAVLVELLDRHTGESKGPRPLTFSEVEDLRQNLAECYLRSREMARLATELAEAVDVHGHARDSVDLNRLVEAAVTLARHRITAETEVFVDLGSLPTVRGSASDLLLVLTRILCLAADSAGAVDGSAISVKTRSRDGAAVVLVSDNGAGRPGALEDTHTLAGDILAACGGTVAGTSEPGHGSAFELTIPLPR